MGHPYFVPLVFQTQRLRMSKVCWGRCHLDRVLATEDLEKAELRQHHRPLRHLTEYSREKYTKNKGNYNDNIMIVIMIFIQYNVVLE